MRQCPVVVVVGFLFPFVLSFGQSEAGGSSSSLIWRVISPSSGDTSYLVGTMHLLCTDTVRISPQLDQLLRRTQIVVMELDLLEENPMDPRVLLKIQKKAVLPDSLRPLSRWFPPEEWKRMDSLSEAYFGIPLSMMENLRPFMIISTYLALAFQKECGTTSGEGTDQQIADIVERAGGNIWGLETLEEQMAIVMDSILFETQLKWLREMFDYLDSLGYYLQEMTRAYLEEDLDHLREIIDRMPGSESMLRNEETARHMLENRNRRWVRKLTPLLHKTGVVIAVGAAHLWGETGLIELLRKEGFIVEPETRFPLFTGVSQR